MVDQYGLRPFEARDPSENVFAHDLNKILKYALSKIAIEHVRIS